MLESSFCFGFLVVESQSFHSPCGRAAYFLCLHKESKQRNAPRMPRSRDKAARVREVMPGFVDCTSLYRQRTRALPARDPTGVSVIPSPRQTGPEDQEQEPDTLF